MYMFTSCEARLHFLISFSKSPDEFIDITFLGVFFVIFVIFVIVSLCDFILFASCRNRVQTWIRESEAIVPCLILVHLSNMFTAFVVFYREE